MKFYLIDREEKMVQAWNKYFHNVDDVEIIHGDFFSKKVDCVVSPANSFGFMDGGLDLVISQRFGWDLQRRVQRNIQEIYGGELLVGQAMLIETNNNEIPWCIVAPTMRIPLFVPETVNAYLASKAIFQLLKTYYYGIPKIASITMSGFCTGVGAMPFDQCARQMKAGYDDFWLEQFKTPKTWIEAKYKHQYLTGWDYNVM